MMIEIQDPPRRPQLVATWRDALEAVRRDATAPAGALVPIGGGMTLVAVVRPAPGGYVAETGLLLAGQREPARRVSDCRPTLDAARREAVAMASGDYLRAC